MKEREVYKKALDMTLLSGDEGLDAILRKGKRNGAPRSWRALQYAAAALLLCVGLTAAIPPARAFVIRLLHPAANIGRYLAAPEEARQARPLPNLEAAMENAEEQPLSVAITYAADAQWQAWAEGIQIDLGKLLYDGETLYIAGTLHGHARDLLKPMSEYIQAQNEQGRTFSPPDSLYAVALHYTLGGETQAYYENVIQRSADASQLNQAYESDSLPISLELPVGAGLTGRQDVTLALLFTDMGTLRAAGETSEEAKDFPSRAVITISGLHFDATAGSAAIQSLPLPAPVDLQGEAAVFALQEGEGTADVGNDLLSLTGGKFAVTSIRQRLEGTELTLCITPPASWTQEQIGSLRNYLFAEFIVDGHNMGGFGQAYNAMRYDGDDLRSIVFIVSTSMQPEDWAAVQTFEIMLTLREMTIFNGAQMPRNSRVTVEYDGRGWSEETEPRAWEDCVLKVK